MNEYCSLLTLITQQRHARKIDGFMHIDFDDRLFVYFRLEQQATCACIPYLYVVLFVHIIYACCVCMFYWHFCCFFWEYARGHSTMLDEALDGLWEKRRKRTIKNKNYFSMDALLLTYIDYQTKSYLNKICSHFPFFRSLKPLLP